MSSSRSAPREWTLVVDTGGVVALIAAALLLIGAIVYALGWWIIPLFGGYLRDRRPSRSPANTGIKPRPGRPYDIEMGPVERPNIYEEQWGVLPLGGTRPLSHPAYLNVYPPRPAHLSSTSFHTGSIRSQDSKGRLYNLFRWPRGRWSEASDLTRDPSVTPVNIPSAEEASVVPRTSIPSMRSLSSVSVSPEITPVPTRVRHQRQRAHWLRRLRRLRGSDPMLVRGAPNRPVEPSWRKPRYYSVRGRTFTVRQPRPLSPTRLRNLFTRSKRRLAFHRQKALDRLNMTRTPPGSSAKSGSSPATSSVAPSPESMDSPPDDLFVQRHPSQGSSLSGSASPILPVERPLDATAGGFVVEDLSSEASSLSRSTSPDLPLENLLEATARGFL